MNEREGRACPHCHAPLRVQALTRALLGEAGRMLKRRVGQPRDLAKGPRLAIAEINRIGGLHEALAPLPGHIYSEYGSLDPAVPSEDLLALSYADASLDLVLTSDTLEHVPDFERALSEIHRVLRPDGAHLFTIPVIWDRPRTRVRARMHDGEIEHLLPPSYHGISDPPPPTCLVFHEFGADVVERIEATGCRLRLIHDDRNPALAVFVTQPPL